MDKKAFEHVVARVEMGESKAGNLFGQFLAYREALLRTWDILCEAGLLTVNLTGRISPGLQQRPLPQVGVQGT